MILKVNMQVDNNIVLEIKGLGIIMYSESSAAHIKIGEDYFTNHFQAPSDVLKHIYNGTIVGFGTGTSGKFILNINDGYPDEKELKNSEYKLRLCIVINDGKIIFRDLYDLFEWNPAYSKKKSFEIDNGIYHITLCTNTPQSGILGDNQVISIFLKKLYELPSLKYEGVPILCY